MNTSNHRDELWSAFWNFLAYLKKIVDVSRDLVQTDSDPRRTRLLSTVTEYLCPVLRAELAFVGYRSVAEDELDWIHVVKDSVRPMRGPHWQSPLIKQLEQMGWCFPYDTPKTMQIGKPEVYINKRLDELPAFFKGVVTALATSRVILLGREYFLFFCDTEEDNEETPRYGDFDKAMLSVAIGLLEVGFQSGVRGGRKDEDRETRQFLSDLANELNKHVQVVLENMGTLQSTLSEDNVEVCERTTRVLNAAHQLDLLVDTLHLSFSEEEPFDEMLVVETIEKPLQEAVGVYAGEATAKGVEIRGPNTIDEQPFPKLPLYPRHLTIAFKHLIRNAIDYSLDDTGQYSLIEIHGHNLGNDSYAIEVTSYGMQITEDELSQELLFKPKYRGEEAKQLVSDRLGLGLDPVKHVVNKHQGKIRISSDRVRSNLYRNTFQVILPIAGPEKAKIPINYDAFLSYHEDDENTVEALARRLLKAGIRPWFSKWDLIPGEPKQEAIEKAMDACQTFVVFLGDSGIGPWSNEETRSALEDRVHDESRHIVPVLLPGAQKPKRKDLPLFLRRDVRWVRFENNLDDIDAFRQLLSGIRQESLGPDDN